MADYDPSLALAVRSPQPQDIIAPLQAYDLAQRGALASVQAQNLGASLAARQGYANALSSGQTPAQAYADSGISVDPDAASSTLANTQSLNTLAALRNYSTNPSNPGTLAMAGPVAVGQASTALSTQATTAETQQDIEAKKANLRGQIALGYKQNQTDQGWNFAAGQMLSSGLIPDLTHYHAVENIKDPQQRLAIANSFIASGAGSVVSSGQSAGAVTQAETLNTVHHVAPGEGLYGSQGLNNAMNGGTPAVPVAGGAPQGRSVAVPSLGGAAAPAGGALSSDTPLPPGAIDVATPEQMRQPPMMTQAENAYGLPAGYLGRTAQIESGGRADAHNAGSGAAGPFQFVPGTWAKYGAPGASPYDPAAATDAAARLASDNSTSLTKALGRPPTAAELYLAHQQGAGGAAGLLSNPNASAASIVGAKAVISNGGTPGMSAGQFAQMWERKFNGASASGGVGNFGLSGPSPMGSGVAMPSALSALPSAPAASLPGAGMVGLRAAAQPDLAPPVTPTPGMPSSPTTAAPAPPSQALGGGPVGDATQGRSASASTPAGLRPTQPLPRSSGGLVPLVQGMTPFALEKQRLDASRAETEETTARDQFVSANAAQSGLMQLQDDLTKLTPTRGAGLLDTLLTPGAGADTRIGLAKTVNSALAAGGYQPLFDQAKISAAESSQKISGRLGFDQAGALGKGEAGFVINQAIGLNPSIMNTPAGSKLLIGSLLASQQRQKDFYLFQQQYKENNNGNPIGAEVLFDQNMPPMQYVQDAKNLARVPPPAVKTLQANGFDQGVISAFNAKYGQGLARYYLGSRTD